MSRVAVAVVGAGYLGQIHVRLLAQRDDVELALVVDPDPQARRRMAESYDVATAASLDELPAHVGAVVIAAPTSHHFELASRLLGRRIHCFIEKPITIDPAEARELVRRASRTELVLQVGHVERFNPAWRATATTSEPTFFQSVRHSGFPARSLDVGVVLDVMIHDIDLLLSLAGERPHRVSAWGQTVVGPHEDVAQAWLEFPGGLTAQLDASRVAPVRQRRVTLVDATGFTWCDLDRGEVRRATRGAELARAADQVATWPLPSRQQFAEELFERWMPVEKIHPEPANAIAREHDEFLHAVRTGAPVSVSGRDGCLAVEVAHEIMRAIETRQQGFPSRIYPDRPADAA